MLIFAAIGLTAHDDGPLPTRNEMTGMSHPYRMSGRGNDSGGNNHGIVALVQTPVPDAGNRASTNGQNWY